MQQRLKKIAERWFLSEPVLFSLYCLHELEEHNEMHCRMRTGQWKIQYNAQRLMEMQTSDEDLDQLMRAEMVRVLLKHPFTRRPPVCSALASALGSDVVLSEYYQLPSPWATARQFQLPIGQAYEWYALQLHELLWNVPDTLQQDVEEEAADKSDLWEEDECAAEQVNEVIRDTQDWGSLPGKLVEQIRASLRVHLDYRRVLSAFHTSVLCSRRRLTRLRPNRRSDFQQMGSRYDMQSRLLVAVDTSGSIRQKDLQSFYSIIQRFFHYGVERVDVVQFDTKIQQISTLCKAPRQVQVSGRGGTDAQVVMDYMRQHPDYDGLIVLTDGYMPVPKLDFHTRSKLLWIYTTEEHYLQHRGRFPGRQCWMTLSC